MQQKKNSFSGSIGFVLAAAGSAVGVGNIWRFPYLCAKDGGGLFLIIYLVLVLTFGFVLLTTDIAIGRKTKKNALNAYAAISSKWKFLGYLTFLVPALIMTYYSVNWRLDRQIFNCLCSFWKPRLLHRMAILLPLSHQMQRLLYLCLFFLR